MDDTLEAKSFEVVLKPLPEFPFRIVDGCIAFTRARRKRSAMLWFPGSYAFSWCGRL